MMNQETHNILEKLFQLQGAELTYLGQRGIKRHKLATSVLASFSPLSGWNLTMTRKIQWLTATKRMLILFFMLVLLISDLFGDHIQPTNPAKKPFEFPILSVNRTGLLQVLVTVRAGVRPWKCAARRDKGILMSLVIPTNSQMLRHSSKVDSFLRETHQYELCTSTSSHLFFQRRVMLL